MLAIREPSSGSMARPSSACGPGSPAPPPHGRVGSAAQNISVARGRLEAVGKPESVMGFPRSFADNHGLAVLAPAGHGAGDPRVGGPSCDWGFESEPAL